MRASWTAGCAAALALMCAGPAAAAEYTPTTFEDQDTGVVPAHCPPNAVETDPENDCSMREAIRAADLAAGDDTVKLAAGRYVLMRSLAIDADGKTTIRGAGARTTIIDADSSQENPGRAFTVRPLAVAELTDLAITGGYMDGDTFLDGPALLVEDDGEAEAEATLRRVHIHDNQTEGYGGAIANQGKLTIDSSLIENNRADTAGGAIENHDQLTIVNSTLSGNQVVDAFDWESAVGGAIDSNPVAGAEPFLKIDSSTITDNSTVGRGGGIVAPDDVPTTVRNSIISGNHVEDHDGEDYPNCLGDPISGGHNLEDGTSCEFGQPGDLNAEPKLGPLAANGGPTNTHALLAGSPAINAGVTADCPVADQRTFGRTDRCDIGAFEVNGVPNEEEPPPPKDDEPKDDDSKGDPGDQQPVQPDPRQPQQSRDCRDRAKPLTSLKRRDIVVTRSAVRLKGRSNDARGECASGLDRVEVSLARVSGTELNCRFIRRPNRFVLTPFRNCRKPVMFRATGASKWSFNFRVALAPGKYRAQARGWDRAGNKETPRKRRSIVYFTVR